MFRLRYIIEDVYIPPLYLNGYYFTVQIVEDIETLLPENCGGYINNHNFVLGLACTKNQQDNIIDSDTSYYLEEEDDLICLINDLTLYSDEIIKEVLAEYDNR